MESDHLGGDILAERRLSKGELRTALSALLSVSPERIFVCEDYEELLTAPDTIITYCRYSHLEGGEFHTVIDLPDGLLHSLPRHATALRLAGLLGCRLLVDDGSINPYAYLFYDEQGNCRPVSLDADAYNRDEYVIRGDQRRQPPPSIEGHL